MAIDPTESGRPLTPEEAAERLRRLEEEAAALRASMAEQVPIDTEPVEQEPEEEPEMESSEPPPQPTPDELAKAERLLQRYRLEHTRGNRDMAAQLLAEAYGIAPGASLVLEVMGDDAASRRQVKEAIDFYLRAKAADPKNVSVDRKHADFVFQTQARMATAGMSQFEAVASSRSAAIFSVILPGLGHIVTGQVAAGIGFVVAWVGFIVWVLIMPDGIRGLMGLFGGSTPFNPLVLLPIFGAVLTWLTSLTTINAHSKTLAKHMGASIGPKPPVDLPY